ncbi:hypothetical protein B0H15DRAFT_863094 [Mycena belliarum]|uniref:G-patch domain-containing protein n=1 Tax=Mycena belliarum TaxID=1033014 RepID=A0AAD6XG97_9AGAR|nr:hypothetical protein B0H15DRAFT_863094 [Mycena belliae]
MGLSGRKEKQRIGADPRNLAWADDAAKFGTSYLSKFGWDSSKGLGASGDGRISHIKVAQKLDMLGIGAGQQKDPNGIAWKQNKDFERLLARLNAGAEDDVKTETAKEDTDDEKKRKREDGDATPVSKKRRKSETEVAVPVEPVKTVVPRHRAHRARAIAAKNMANKSAASISEILGIAPTPTTIAATRPEGLLTTFGDDVPLEKLTTSTKSVADYFKEKLLAKAGKSESATPAPCEDMNTESGYDTPRRGLGSSHVKLEPKDEDADRPMRMGLSNLLASSFFSASKPVLAAEVTVKSEEEVEEKKERTASDEDTGKRKGKRSQMAKSESAASQTEAAPEKKKKKQKKQDGEQGASQADTVNEDEPPAVDEDERKRLKQERKRLKALKKESKAKAKAKAAE